MSSPYQPQRSSISTKGSKRNGDGRRRSRQHIGLAHGAAVAVREVAQRPAARREQLAGRIVRARTARPPPSSVSRSPRCSTRASAPIVRSSSPTQLLIADGVSVQRLVQPTPSFSSETGGKNAPALRRPAPRRGRDRPIAQLGLQHVERGLVVGLRLHVGDARATPARAASRARSAAPPNSSASSPSP